MPRRTGPGAADAFRRRLDRLPVALPIALADRVPDAFRSARAGPSRRAVLGVIAVGLAVAVVLGVRLAIATAAARPTAVVTADPAGGQVTGATATTPNAAGVVPGASATGAPTSAPAVAQGSPQSASSPAGAALVVYVAGRVRHPGVVRLPAGSRVQDALRAAGGALAGSDLVGINLAQPLVDGEQVLVARAGQASSASATGVGGGASAGSAGSSAGGALGSSRVSLNSADAGGLDALPGVGPVLAQRIVDWRTAHGRFSSVDELDEVSGIGDKLLAEIRPHVTL